MSVPVTDWSVDVLRYIKGIDNSAFTDLLSNEILETLRDFCRETDIWSVTLPAISTVIGNSTYQLAYPGIAVGSQVWRVEQVWFKADGETDDQYQSVGPIVDWRADESEKYWRAETGPVPSAYHHLVESQKILLTPIPDVGSDDGLLVKVSLIPRLDATKIESFIFDRWKRGITYGVVSGLMRMTNKPWADLKMSEVYKGFYIEARDNAFETKQAGANRRPINAVGAGVKACGIGSRQRMLL
jgi:hypothetical protein